MNGTNAVISLEVVAAITAALSAVLGQPAGNFLVRSIQPVTPLPAPAGAWAKAGLLESHLARRQYGIRTR